MFKNPVIIIIIIISVFFPIKSYSQQTQSLGIQANRCRYYYIRSRSGDHTARNLLIYREGDIIDITGLNNCINVIDNYLQQTNVTPEEKQVYENVKNHLSSWRNQIKN
ncbi:hypothetical protein GM3708_916 [Geminocystis sp. NIES-3708]|uniref:hypothetical protein n=1 Tax=Geminocystis sp. NIES-3708 TaxID=1615909 RepID=UPI0005FCDC43|nr:hypothetical protein [Geminocystis sp. NIES-3708]BAQ60510.1 hypothetical protein GM3708_916 [Geminocystis sp. NIES-3708]